MSALKKAAYPLTGSVTGTASLALILPLLSVGLSQQQFSVISTVGKADPWLTPKWIVIDWVMTLCNSNSMLNFKIEYSCVYNLTFIILISFLFTSNYVRKLEINCTMLYSIEYTPSLSGGHFHLLLISQLSECPIVHGWAGKAHPIRTILLLSWLSCTKINSLQMYL